MTGSRYCLPGSEEEELDSLVKDERGTEFLWSDDAPLTKERGSREDVLIWEGTSIVGEEPRITEVMSDEAMVVEGDITGV